MFAEEFRIKDIDLIAYKNLKKKTVVVKPDCRYISIKFQDQWIEIKNDNFMGKATSHPDEEFQYHKGVQLATNRVLKQIYKAFRRKLNKIDEELELLGDYVLEHTKKTNKHIYGE